MTAVSQGSIRKQKDGNLNSSPAVFTMLFLFHYEPEKAEVLGLKTQ